MTRVIQPLPVCLLLCLAVPVTSRAGDPQWVSLFNGQDLTGWEPRLGKPTDGAKADNRDPAKVFSVVTEDGEPAIRISGDGLGGLATLKIYGNYHLELEFKWGEKRNPPR